MGSYPFLRNTPANVHASLQSEQWPKQRFASGSIERDRSHIFRHNLTGGHTHVRRLNNDGPWGATVYDKNWKSGYSSFNFHNTGTGNSFILRYNRDSGDANILNFDSTVNGLNNTSIVLNSQWSLNWGTIRFFTTSEGTFNFRYNPENGWVRIQEVRSNGTLGAVVLSTDNRWLRQRSSDGPFRPATSGWDTVEFYFAKDIVNEPAPPRAIAGPPRAEGGNDDTVVEFPPPSFPCATRTDRSSERSESRTTSPCRSWRKNDFVR